MNKLLFRLPLALLSFAIPAYPGIQYTCDASFSDPTNSAPAGLCGALNGSAVANMYASVFSNANAKIYIQFGATGVGSSTINLLSVPYSTYYGALSSQSTDPAVQSLTSIDPLTSLGNSDQMIDVSAALGSALGLNGAANAGIVADASDPSGYVACDLNGAGPCYNGYITMAAGGAFYYPTVTGDDGDGLHVDFYLVVEHETDEILGTISCIGNPAVDACGDSDASAADLFRYASPGTRSFLTTANGSLAYFSTNGGQTNISTYVNSTGLGDYGDWTSNGTKVQNSSVAPGYADILTDGGSEIAVLNAVGFSIIPEPGTWGLIGIGLLALARLRKGSNRR